MSTLSRLFGQREVEERGVGKVTERGRRTVLARFGAVLGALAFLVLFLPVREVQAQLTVIATIPVGTAPTGLGVNPNTNRIYVANGGSNTVSVIDGATNAVVATIPVTTADGVGVNTTTNRVYVNGGTFPAQTVSVIDGTPGSLTENTVIATIPVPGRLLIASRGIGVNPITNRIYVPSFDPGGAVVVIDGFTNTFSLIGVAANPFAAAVNATTNRIYVGHGQFFFRRRITVIDGATNAASDGAEVGLAQVSIGVNSPINRIYVKKGDLSRGEPLGVVVVDSNTNAVLATIPGGAPGGGLGVNSTTNRIYVTNQSANTVSVIDGTPGSPTENTFVASVGGVGSSPSDTFIVGVNPRTDRIYVSNSGSNTVSVIEDCTAPVISGASASPSVLWPPNHKMVEVTVSYTDTSNCPATCTLSVASNEPINGTGDGNTSPDWQVIDANHVLLRAERAGTGTGRIYTITITCTNSAGQSSSQSVTVSVPHDQR